MVLQAIPESCKWVVRGAKTRTSDASWKIANSRLRLIGRITSGDQASFIICVFLGYKVLNFVKKVGCYRCLENPKI